MTEALAILALAVLALFFGHRGRGVIGPLCWILVGVILVGGSLSAAASNFGDIIVTTASALGTYFAGVA